MYRLDAAQVAALRTQGDAQQVQILHAGVNQIPPWRSGWIERTGAQALAHRIEHQVPLDGGHAARGAPVTSLR